MQGGTWNYPHDPRTPFLSPLEVFSGQSYSGLKVDDPYEHEPIQEPGIFYQNIASDGLPFVLGNIVGGHQCVCLLLFVSTYCVYAAELAPLRSGNNKRHVTTLVSIPNLRRLRHSRLGICIGLGQVHYVKPPSTVR
jgi:hypothetical protein